MGETIRLSETIIIHESEVRIEKIRCELQELVNWCVKRAELDTANTLVRILDEIK